MGSIESNRGQTAFARVYEDHVWRVYGFLAYRLRDRQATEDLLWALLNTPEFMLID